MFEEKPNDSDIIFKKSVETIPNSIFSDIWVYSQEFYNLPEYGYKIHISCDNNNYRMILDACIPYLIKNKISFKMVSNYFDFISLNKGDYGYTQIGKTVTIYPENVFEFKKIIFELYLMTKYIRSINIPSDFSFLNSEVIYYRFGELNTLDGDKSKKKIDRRTRYIDKSCKYFLPWHDIKKYSAIPNFLYPIQDIQSTSKSKIFKAYDSRYKKFCLLKVGIFLGNIENNKIDSFDRIAWESFIFKQLSFKKYVPNYVDAFIVGRDFFLLEEFIKGCNLEKALVDNLLVGKESDISLKIFNIVKDLHSLGYRIIDLSLNNFMFDLRYVYIIDMEYMYKNSSNYYYIENYNQGTIGYFFPELKLSPILFDIYALYKVLYFVNNRSEYIKFISTLKEQSFNEYKESFVNKVEQGMLKKMSKYYNIDIYKCMIEFSYEQHLLFLSKFINKNKGKIKES